MDLSQLELHDANLLGVTLDAGARTVEIRLAYYASERASSRTLGSLRFSGVSQFNQVADLERLADHASAGNVIQWRQAERSGAACLHLVGGLIAVTATSVEFVAT
ncbi:hypothetical protein LVB77_12050 [Lysobacter sp. 5GHs7-4]|uniref:hypothetical protein n=1 Tax=Lysobacter sp. 5GHs7-4 TaxID=2904253 RepID=UPI001E600386|nr:hypothetical protein [Lysobacter sp. 5GHs7-4]UHQ21416.1 hypothetical protein LVB77_12050 [Lysobacter sp. 5GHs7-4]